MEKLKCLTVGWLILKTLKSNKSGFTFIEVMIATVIFVLAALAAMDLARGSVRAVKEAQEITQATWLLQKVMVELETKIETEGIEKGCEEKKEGTFDEPYNRFTYTTYCSEIDFRLSETASQLLGEGGSGEGSNVENMTQKMILNLASDYISKASRELHAEVKWMQGKTPKKIDVTTHVANYTLPFTLPAGLMPGTGGGGGGS